MYQIGEFSRIARVTIETLRHYDKLGLLKPAKVDPITGYRYYSAGQLQTLNQIFALRETGLSLEEISRILKKELTTDEVRGILKAQLVLAENAIDEAQQRRHRILARLENLDLDETMPEYEVSLKSADAFTVAAVREIIPSVEEIPQRWNKLFTTIADWLRNKRLAAGVPMVFYHDEGHVIEQIDAECAFIILNVEADKLPEAPEPIVIRQTEAFAQVASIVVTDFHMQVEGLKPAYAALGKWIATHHYHIIGAARELYYGSPETGDFTSEIQFPVAKFMPE